MSRGKVTLTKYENIKTGNIYYGYPEKTAMKKDIDGVTYIEVTPSVVTFKQMWVKLDALADIGSITFDKP